MRELRKAVEACIRSKHPEVLAAIDSCADEVCASWDGDPTRGSRAVVDPLTTRLEERGVLDRLPRVLADAVEVAGYDLPATPVAAPPYVVVTSRGPILRATIDPGRLVIRFDAFEIVRSTDGAVRYRRREGVAPVASLVPIR